MPIETFEAQYDARPWTGQYLAAGQSPDLPPLRHANVAALLRSAAKQYSSRTAFTVCLDNGLTGSLSFQAIDVLGDAFASYLRDTLGLNKGDRVAVQLPNCLAFPIAAFGILKAGCVLVNVNPLYTAPEMQHQLSDSGAKAIVIIDLFADKLTDILSKTSVQHVITANVADFFPLLTGCVVKTVLKLKRQIPSITFAHTRLPAALAIGEPKATDATRYAETLSLSEIAVLQYTGGTTGISKGAMLSHGNVLANVEQTAAAAGPHIPPGAATMLTVLPMYHIFAFDLNLMYGFLVGASNVLIPSPRPINKVRKAFAKYDFHLFSGLNILFNALLNESWFREHPPRNLKVTIAGGAALHKSVAERWLSVVGHPLYEGYGMTEASPVISVNPIGGKIKLGSVGVPLPSTWVRIVDEQGNAVALGEIGEIAVKGPQVMLGYWQRPDETQKVMRDSWLLTGDIGRMDDEGYLYIVDRKKDMIIVNGFNVYPNEIEDCIARHPDVIEVAVIGEDNEKTGETVAAFIVARNASLTEKEIQEHCHRELTNYKVPKRVVFRSELPKSPIGKILRKELRRKPVS